MAGGSGKRRRHPYERSNLFAAAAPTGRGTGDEDDGGDGDRHGDGHGGGHRDGRDDGHGGGHGIGHSGGRGDGREDEQGAARAGRHGTPGTRAGRGARGTHGRQGRRATYGGRGLRGRRPDGGRHRDGGGGPDDGRRHAKPGRSWVGWVSAGTLTLAGGIVLLLGTGGPLTSAPPGTAGATDGGQRARPDDPAAAARGGDTRGPRSAGSGQEAAAAGGTDGSSDGNADGRSDGGGAGDSGAAGKGTAGGDPEVSAGGRTATGEASKDTDHQAIEYFRARWGSGDAAARHVKDIRTVGGYLRIYTDLPESADDSAAALALCERGLAYLGERGTKEPVVFVQARPGENGSPVLANILGPGDTTCRVTHPDPG
ncbi:MAG: hypothetical protein K0R62_8491 [Nonomuraea muscovyensis]|nr:hypothetical protein [Nonomuraea muscovyensis]